MHNDSVLKLFIVFCRTFHTVSETVKHDIKSYGLNLTEFAALELLYHKGPQTIQDIGKKVLLTSGSMTYVVNQLEKKNLLARAVCPNDKRITYVEITAAGIRLFDDIFPHHQTCIANIFASLTQQEIQSLTQTLKQISHDASNTKMSDHAINEAKNNTVTSIN